MLQWQLRIPIEGARNLLNLIRFKGLLAKDIVTLNGISALNELEVRLVKMFDLFRPDDVVV